MKRKNLGNVIVVCVALMFIGIFMALVNNPPYIGWALFCAVFFLIGVLLLWHRDNKNQKNTALDEKE